MKQLLIVPDGKCEAITVSFSGLTVDTTSFQLKVNGIDDTKLLAKAVQSLYLVYDNGAYNITLEDTGRIQNDPKAYVIFNNLTSGTRYKLELQLSISY